jgi:NAD+ diphosphatase
MEDEINGVNKKDQSQQSAAALAHSDPSITASANVKTTEPRGKISDDEEPPFRVPPMTAIAGVLIRHWAEGKMQATLQKGNL